MIRNWKMLSLQTFMAAALGSAAFAADDAAKPNGDSKKLEEISSQLKKLEDIPERLKSIETSVGSLTVIKADLKRLREDLDASSTLNKAKFQGIDDRIGTLEEAIKKLTDKKADARIALSPPDAPLPAATSDLKKISEGLESIVAELKGLRTDLNAGAAGNQLQLKDLNSKIAGLEKTMTALRDRLQFSKDPEKPGTSTTTDKLALTGKIRLRNDFVTPVSIVVNGKSRRLDPGETYTMNDVPAGTFSFEVIGVQARKLETLAANETYTISVYSR